MKRRWVILPALLLAGVGTAWAVGGATTGTVTACATASVGAQTIAANGAPVGTIPAASKTQCSTVTYTVPTETVTTGATATAPTTTTAPATTTAVTTTAPTTTTPAAGQPSGFSWLADYRNNDLGGLYGDGRSGPLLQDDMHMDQTVNDPDVGVTKGNTVVAKPVPGYTASAYSNRVVVSAGFNQTGSTSGASTTLWQPNYYWNAWEQNGAKTWFRIRVLFPDGTHPAYPGATHPEPNLSAGWDIFGEWHRSDVELNNHGGLGGGASGSTNLGFYRWTVNGTPGVPVLLFRPANSWWLLETDQTQTKADSILMGAAQPRGNVQALQFNHWYDFLVYQEFSPNSTTGYLELWVDGKLRFADHLATLAQAKDGYVPGVAFEGGLYRAYVAGQPNDILYQGAMIAGPSRASVGG